MANYHCAIRTNYFHVKDSELFRQFMSCVYGADGSIELWEEKDADGQATFAFGANGGISGLRMRLTLTKRATMCSSAASNSISGKMTR